jgi:hypothetical protein
MVHTFLTCQYQFFVNIGQKINISVHCLKHYQEELNEPDLFEENNLKKIDVKLKK